MPEYIDTAPDIFEICCVTGCGADATVCVAAHLKNKQSLYLPTCTDRDHIEQILLVQTQLLGGKPVRKIEGIELDEVFTKHRHNNLKCKLLEWEKEQKELKKKKTKTKRPWEEEEEESTPPSGEEHVAVKYWEWIEDTDVWMDVAGNIVRIRKLDKEEFRAAVSTICAVNLSRITKRNAWVKKFRVPTPQYIYPTGPMKVGSRTASEKLEEFREAADVNQWL